MGEQHVRLDFAAAGLPGITDVLIRLLVDEEEAQTIHVTGKVIRQQLQLLTTGTDTQLDFVDAGQFYYGTSRVVKATIYNDRPCMTQYFFNVTQSHAWLYTANGRERCSTMEACTNPVLTVEPAEGHLMPQEKRVVTLSIQPQLPPEDEHRSQVRAPIHLGDLLTSAERRRLGNVGA